MLGLLLSVPEMALEPRHWNGITCPFPPQLGLCYWGAFWKARRGGGCLPGSRPCREGVGTCGPSPRLLGGVRAGGWLNHQQTMASSHTSAWWSFHKHPKVGVSEGFQVGESEQFHVPLCWATGTEASLLRTWPYALSSYPLTTFVINQ